MKEVTIEELKERFLVRDVSPYGFVVMIPGKDFDPDWEALLEEEGFGCVFTEINDSKFTLVKLEKDEEETAVEPSHVPKREDSGKFKRHSGAQPGQKMIHWSDADEKRLLKRIVELPGFLEEKVAGLVQEFPGRTAAALQKKYEKLTRGKRSRKVRSGKTLTKKLLAERESERPKEEPVSWVDAAAKLDIVKTLADLEDCVGELLNMAKIDHDIISRLNCAILLQAMETIERQGELTIPHTLREHYLDALLQPEAEKYVEIFNAKCRALMEASS